MPCLMLAAMLAFHGDLLDSDREMLSSDTAILQPPTWKR
jgi:hypothetical protein